MPSASFFPGLTFWPLSLASRALVTDTVTSRARETQKGLCWARGEAAKPQNPGSFPCLLREHPGRDVAVSSGRGMGQARPEGSGNGGAGRPGAGGTLQVQLAAEAGDPV